MLSIRRLLLHNFKNLGANSKLNSLVHRHAPVVISTRHIPAALAQIRYMTSKQSAADDGGISKEIEELIKERIRPSIQEHGGDVEFVCYTNNVVKVKLQGACSTCPSSVITLQNGIKNMLQFYVPEIEDVEQVFDGDPSIESWDGKAKSKT